MSEHVSLELSSVCVVDGRAKIVKEAKVASEPEALVCFFKKLGVFLTSVVSVAIEVSGTHAGSHRPACAPVYALSLISSMSD